MTLRTYTTEIDQNFQTHKRIFFSFVKNKTLKGKKKYCDGFSPQKMQLSKNTHSTYIYNNYLCFHFTKCQVVLKNVQQFLYFLDPLITIDFLTFIYKIKTKEFVVCFFLKNLTFIEISFYVFMAL